MIGLEKCHISWNVKIFQLCFPSFHLVCFLYHVAVLTVHVDGTAVVGHDAVFTCVWCGEKVGDS